MFGNSGVCRGIDGMGSLDGRCVTIVWVRGGRLDTSDAADDLKLVD